MQRDTGTAVRAVLAAALVSALVAGCTGGGSAPQAATLSPTPSPTVSSVSPSASPTLTTEGQVEAAVRTYYTELTKAGQSLDTTILKKLVTKNCPCYGSVRSFEEGKRKRLRAPDLAWTLKSVKVHDVEPSLAAAEVRYVVDAYDVFDSNEEVVASYKKSTRHFDLSLVLFQGLWRVTNTFNMEQP